MVHKGKKFIQHSWFSSIPRKFTMFLCRENMYHSTADASRAPCECELTKFADYQREIQGTKIPVRNICSWCTRNVVKAVKSHAGIISLKLSEFASLMVNTFLPVAQFPFCTLHANNAHYNPLILQLYDPFPNGSDATRHRTRTLTSKAMCKPSLSSCGEENHSLLDLTFHSQYYPTLFHIFNEVFRITTGIPLFINPCKLPS